MALAVTLEELRASARADADAENDAHITDAALTQWANRGVREYARRLADADSDRFLTTATITTTAGVLEVALPSDFWRLRGVDLLEGGQLRTLKAFPFEERARRRAFGGQGADGLPRYRVVRGTGDGSTERLLFDIDPGQRAYTLHYLPVPVVLVEDGDAIDDALGFSDFVVAFMRAKIRGRRDEPATEEAMDMARAAAAIALDGQKRHVDGGERVPRVRVRRHSNNPLRYRW